jgi:hypothetical protein
MVSGLSNGLNKVHYTVTHPSFITARPWIVKRTTPALRVQSLLVSLARLCTVQQEEGQQLKRERGPQLGVVD